MLGSKPSALPLGDTPKSIDRQPVKERRAIQPPGHETSKVRRRLEEHGLSLGLGAETGEDAGPGPGQPGLSEATEPGEGPCHGRIDLTHDFQAIVAVIPRKEVGNCD